MKGALTWKQAANIRYHIKNGSTRSRLRNSRGRLTSARQDRSDLPQPDGCRRITFSQSIHHPQEKRFCWMIWTHFELEDVQGVSVCVASAGGAPIPGSGTRNGRVLRRKAVESYNRVNPALTVSIRVILLMKAMVTFDSIVFGVDPDDWLGIRTLQCNSSLSNPDLEPIPVLTGWLYTFRGFCQIQIRFRQL